MKAKYILRLDDACPTMDREKWGKIEVICDKYNIKPIVAVIPNNRDLKQMKNKEDPDFWERVKEWQSKGWYIALHGYEHVYITRHSGLLPFNRQSEFAGLSYEEQAEKIRKGWKVFQEKGIKAKIWVAPSHTFDENTLRVLKAYTDIEFISDGIAVFPFEKYGFKWIPQQFWRFRKMPFGVWTVCLHPNEMKEEEFLSTEDFIKKNYKYFIDIEKLKYRRFCLLNIIFEKTYWILRRIKNANKI